MDSFDRRLLELVQADCRLTHEQLADKVHLSPTSVRRRLARLRADGVIIGDVSLVDPGKLGITVIVSVTMQEETLSNYKRFKQRMRNAAEVSQCYTVSGETDFIVIAHMSDLERYEAWLDEYIIGDDTIRRSDTNIVYSRVKYTTSLPVTD